MKYRKNILAISGSTRDKSSNMNLIKAIIKISGDFLNVNIFNGLTEIPHFNPDLDNENPPLQVLNFRKQIGESEGILICTPEYAMGVPGTLKNAIDWTVSSANFYLKPTALITASTLGQKGHNSLMETLKIIDADINNNTQLVISHIKTKVNAECKITDNETLNQINELLQCFNEVMSEMKVTNASSVI